MKHVLAALGFLLAAENAHALRPEPINRFTTKAALDNGITAVPDEAIACAADTHTCYVRSSTSWLPVGWPKTPEFSVTFNEGASKGLALLKFDGTAYSTTAAVHNDLYYDQFAFKFVTIATATGTVTPAAEANGLDLNAGSPGNNDHATLFVGTAGTSTRPFIVGTDPAFKVCATVKFHDVSGSDGFWIGFRTMDVPVVITSYTDYAAIGNVSGTIYVNDKTTGATTTTDTWADDASKTLCTLVSAAGVVTYTNGGAAPTATDPHTLSDGLPVIPFIQLINDTDIADDTWLVSWAASYQ